MARCAVWAGMVFVLQMIASPPVGLQASAAEGPATDCTVLPPINPHSDFLGNFLTPCYINAMGTGHGGTKGGDLNAVYNTIYYHVTPGYELVVVGAFPNARFFSATVYDAHSVQTSHLLDSAILPLFSSMVNPFQPGVSWAPNQNYGLTVGFGSPPPTSAAPGCSTEGSTIDQNFLDASQIHSGLTWTGDPLVPPGFPPHQTGANTGGYVMLRRYVDISSVPAASVIVRQLSDGCAISAAQAVSQGILTHSGSVATSWMNSAQIGAHQKYAEDIQPKFCFGPDPQNWAQWRRGKDYVPGNDNDGVYVATLVDSSMIAEAGRFIRLHFRLPAVPNTPCATGACALTGQEQMRYFSFSFQNGASTLASVKDSDLVKDPNGNVTLIVGLGTQPPAYVQPSNYYTYLDLAKVADPLLLVTISIRNILPNSSFDCSGFNVPLRTSEYNPNGGYMGAYAPTVDYPMANQIPKVATPVTHPDTCDLIPTQTPPVCAVM